MNSVIEIFAFSLCSGLCILVTLCLINIENRKEYNLSKENASKLNKFGKRLYNWKKGNYNPIINPVRKRG